MPYEGPTKEYVVKSGDSLGKIAMEYGISIRALKALNGLQTNQLRAGQKLKVPTEKQTAAKAAVAAAKPAAVKPAAAKPAEPAKDAAPKKDVAAPTPAAVPEAKPAEVAAAKPAETAKPAEAVKTEAPSAPVAEPAAPAVEATAAPAPTYTVKEGDDLVSIAIAYGIAPSALMDINDLKPTEEVKPGQVLKLPPNAKVSVQ